MPGSAGHKTDPASEVGVGSSFSRPKLGGRSSENWAVFAVDKHRDCPIVCFASEIINPDGSVRKQKHTFSEKLCQKQIFLH